MVRESEIPGPPKEQVGLAIEKVEGLKGPENRAEVEPRFRPPTIDKEKEKELAALETAMALAESARKDVRPTTPEEYCEKYLPVYLKKRSVVGAIVTKAIDLFFRLKESWGSFLVEGVENIPASGPFLIVSNHSGGETGKLLAVFGDKQVHLSAGEKLNFKRSKFREKLLKALRMIPVKESLSHLSEEEKDDLILGGRVPRRSIGGYLDVLAAGTPQNRDFIHSAVAALIKGEPVVVFPEGLFTYQGIGLRKAYDGWQLMAREYQRQTGQELPILPIGVTKKSVSVGRITSLAGVENTDGLMRRVAAQLPENMQGVYKIE